MTIVLTNEVARRAEKGVTWTLQGPVTSWKKGPTAERRLGTVDLEENGEQEEQLISIFTLDEVCERVRR